MAEPWLRAGEFARRSRLSPKALRLYADIGLLVPSAVDDVNRYRRYHEGQLRDARLIGTLRRADVPLALVQRILAAPREQRQPLIDAYRDEVERTIHYRQLLLEHLSRTLSGGKEHYPMLETKVRQVPEQTVLTEQAYVNAAQLPDWIVQAGLRQLAAAEAVGGQVGPALVIYHGDVTEDSDGPVESAIPIAAARATDAALPVRVEPAHREAYVTITRAQVRFPDILSAYDAVERWVRDNDRSVVGSAREVYFADPSTGDDDEPVADVAFPID